MRLIVRSAQVVRHLAQDEWGGLPAVLSYIVPGC